MIIKSNLMLSQDKVKGLGGWLIFIVVSITITLLTHTLLTLNMCFEYFMGKPLPGVNPRYGFPVTLIGLTLQVVILLFYPKRRKTPSFRSVI